MTTAIASVETVQTPEQIAALEKIGQEAAALAVEMAKRLNTFEASRHGRKTSIQQAWSDHFSSATADLLLIGADIAEYVTEGIAAGIARADLVKDCLGADCSDADVARALSLHWLGKLSGADLSTISMRRVDRLLPLVKREPQTERYSLACDLAKVQGLLTAVLAGEVSTREAVAEHVGKLLGKETAKPTASASNPPVASTAQSPTVAAVASVPVAEDRPAGVGAAPLDCAQTAYKAITSAHDTGAAVRAFGAILGANPKLLMPLVAGLVEWADGERNQQASMVYSALVLAIKQGAEKLVASGLKIGG